MRSEMPMTMVFIISRTVYKETFLNMNMCV